jgi:hypothetical protein
MKTYYSHGTGVLLSCFYVVRNSYATETVCARILTFKYILISAPYLKRLWYTALKVIIDTSDLLGAKRESNPTLKAKLCLLLLKTSFKKVIPLIFSLITVD